MEKKIIIFGSGMHAREFYYLFGLEGKTVEAFTVDAKFKDSDTLFGKPLVAFEEVQDIYPPDDYEIFISIGMPEMNRARPRIYTEIKQKGYNCASYISPYATILTDEIGEGNVIAAGCYIGVFTKIGNANFIANGCNISHNCTIKDYCFFAPSVASAGNVVYGDGCFLGTNCTLRNSIEIGEYSLVGAGTYVPKSLEPYSVIVPARSVILDKKSTDFMK